MNIRNKITSQRCNKYFSNYELLKLCNINIAVANKLNIATDNWLGFYYSFLLGALSMKKLVMVLAISALSSQAFAADSQLAGVYGGAELGYSKIQNQSQAVANQLVNAVGGAVSVTQDSGVAVGRVFGGYNINENFALEFTTTSINSSVISVG